MIDCIVWEITLKCNAKCIHCGSNAGKPDLEELTTNEALNLIDQFKQIGCKNVSIIGGELFLRNDWKLIINKLYRENISTSIVTNGSFLTEENLIFLKNNDLRTLGISIDASNAKTNDKIRGVNGLFKTTLKGVKNANNSGLELCVISTLNKMNLLELKEMLNLFSKLPFKVWQIQKASSNGRMISSLVLDTYEYYIASLCISQCRLNTHKDTLAIVCNHDFGYYSKVIPQHTIYHQWTGCPAGINTIGIKSNGNIQGCLSLDSRIFTENNIRNQSLSKIISNKNFCNWNKKSARQIQLKDFCSKCEYFKVCAGGCTDIAHSLTKNISNNPHCYHRIEQLTKNLQPQNDFEHIFKSLASAKFNHKNQICLEKNQILNTKLLDTLRLNDYQRQLLGLLVNKERE